MKKIVILFIILLLIAFLATAAVEVGQHMLQTDSTTAQKFHYPMPVRVAEAQKSTLTELLGAPGEVQPIALVNITSKVLERVEAIHVDLGHTVAPRQMLIQINRDLSDAAFKVAQSNVEQANEEVSQTTLHWQRIKALYEQELVAKVELEKAWIDVVQAQTKYSEAQEKLVQAKQTLKYVTITSPVAGIVMERLIHVGEMPKANQTLLTLGQIDKVLVEAKVPEERVRDVSLQQPATVTFNAFPNDVIAGEVVKIKPVTEAETKTFRVYVKVDNAKLRLKPGLTGFVRLQRSREVLAIPSVALINPTGIQESSVFVVGPDSHARLQRVKIGGIAEGMTEIVHGLEAGAQVVVVGHAKLKDGDEVRIGEGSEMALKAPAEMQLPAKAIAAVTRILGLQEHKGE